MKIKTLKDFLSSFPVVARVIVQWGEMDAFQHVNNVTYFRYQETARILHFEQIAKTMGNTKEAHEFFTATGVGPIMSETTIKFKAPVKYPDVLLVGSRLPLEEIAGSRMKQHYAMWTMQGNCIAAEGSGTIVAYDYRINKPVDFPKTIVDAITTISKQNSLHLEQEILSGKISLSLK
jgi:acyl-CoA thioester hydrolase